MNAISKRLLSWLCVIAMVLSFVPVMDLSGFAVETKAAGTQEEEIVYGSANLTADQQNAITAGNAVQTAAKAISIPDTTEGATFDAECPVCKTTQTWTVTSKAIGTKNDGAHHHYAWIGTIADANNKWNWASAQGTNTKICILMKDAVLTGGGTFFLGGTDTGINMMGTGTFTSDGTTADKAGLLKNGGTRSKYNIYGGTFVYTGSCTNANSEYVYAAATLSSNGQETNLYADATIGKATEDTTAACYNVIVKGGTLNMYGGTIRNGISDNSNRSGNVTLNGATAVFNMYGGTISGGSRAATATSAATAGHAVRIAESAGVFNMYGGLITGGKSWNGGQGGSVYTQVTGDNNIAKAVLNLQGGTITGGQSNAHGGSVSGWRGTINIGGTVLIEGGQVKNVTSHGGSNIYIPNAPLVVNITGGKLKAGTVAGNNALKGGNIYNNATTNTYAQLNISGGVIEGGKAGNGGNIYCEAGAPISITGGKISGGTATSYGGNIYFADSATISGATITGGTAMRGGNVYMPASKTLEITSGTVELGVVADVGTTSNDCAQGGNIYSAGDVTIGANAKILNGHAKSVVNGGGGGNIYVYNAKLTTSGTITGGRVEADEENKIEKPQASGGNIHIAGDNAICQVDGGVIANGYVDCAGGHGAAFGGNIRAWNSSVIINDGLIYGGTGNTGNGASIGVQGGPTENVNKTAKLHINGGIIVGDVSYSDYVPETAAGTGTYKVDIKLTGSPKIYKSYNVPNVGTVTASTYGLRVMGKATVDISELNAEAHIEVTCAFVSNLDQAFTIANANAANVLSAFSSTNSSHIVALTDDGQQLKVIEKPVVVPEVGVFNPEECENMAYCPACIAQGKSEAEALVEWTKIDNTWVPTANFANGSHYYFSENITAATSNSRTAYLQPDGNGAIACVNLNGKDVTMAAGQLFVFAGNGTLNLMDTAAKQGTVTGAEDANGVGATIQFNGGSASGKVNVYGGIYTKSDAAGCQDNPIVNISNHGGTFTMYGGVIDGKNIESSVACVQAWGGIKNAADDTTKYYGLAKVILKGDAKIINGNNTNGAGGNVMIGDGNKAKCFGAASLEISENAEISGGKATTFGGNVNLFGEGTLTMNGGLITNGTSGTVSASGSGGNISGNAGTVITINGGEVSNGTVVDKEGAPGGTWGGNIRSWNGKVAITGGLIYGGYDVEVSQGNYHASNIGVMGDANGEKKSVLEISGDAVILGDILVSAPAGTADAETGDVNFTFTGTTVKLSGNPQIVMEYEHKGETLKALYTGLHLNTKKIGDVTYPAVIDIEDLESGANVAVETSGGLVFTTAKTGLTDCFTSVNGMYYVAENADNKYYLEKCLAGIILSKDKTVWYPTAAEAVAAYTGVGVLRPNADQQEFVLSDADTNYYIDGRGYNVTVSGTGKLYAMDNANTENFRGYGRWYIAESVDVIRDVTNPVTNQRFIVLDEKSANGESYYGAHYIEVKLTNVALRTGPAVGDFSNPGLFYKASYMCDSTLAGRITTYGVALSLDAIPGDDFISCSAMENFKAQYDAEKHTVAGNSCALVNIMSETATDNFARVNKTVYANAYIEVDIDNDKEGDTIFMGDNANIGKTDAGVRYSMLDVLKYIDSHWDQFESQHDLVKDFISHWIAKDSGLQALATELPTIAAALNA